jgi:hypothetical protein
VDELDEEYHVMIVIDQYRNHRHHQSSAFVYHTSSAFVLDCHFDLDHNHIYIGDGINNTTSSGWWGD